MFKYNCLNPIASVGLDLFSNDYEKVEDLGRGRRSTRKKCCHA